MEAVLEYFCHIANLDPKVNYLGFCASFPFYLLSFWLGWEELSISHSIPEHFGLEETSEVIKFQPPTSSSQGQGCHPVDQFAQILVQPDLENFQGCDIHNFSEQPVSVLHTVTVKDLFLILILNLFSFSLNCSPLYYHYLLV